MFGGSLFRVFEDDPFFSDHNRRMQEMHQQMMGGLFQSPFMALPMPQQPALPAPPSAYGRDYNRRGERRRERSQHSQMVPQGHFGGHDMFGDMFGHMNRMMQSMRSAMDVIPQGYDRIQTDPNSHFYSQSTVMSYSNTGNGPPKVYQATSSTRQVPGGVKETRKSERDSETGIEKMAVGHHIHDRAHVISRSRNTRTGDLDENQDYINLDENEAESFDQEFRHKVQQYSHGSQHRGLTHGRSRYDPSRRPTPAIDYRDRE